MDVTNHLIPEASFPLIFRSDDAKRFAAILKKRESVCLVAMKKVGISGFLRFFYYHPFARDTYLGKENEKLLFVFCDFNELFELTPHSLWTYLALCIAKSVREDARFLSIAHTIEQLALQAAQITDAFRAYYTVKTMTEELCKDQESVSIVLILMRFDRLVPIGDSELFTSLQNLFDAVKFRLVFVTTSVRPLPDIFPRMSHWLEPHVLTHQQYIKPLTSGDRERLSSYFNLTTRYDTTISARIRYEILTIGGGHTLLTRLAGIAWSALPEAVKKNSTFPIDDLVDDERIRLACNEIWHYLTNREREAVRMVVAGKRVMLAPKDYLFTTGIINAKEKSQKLFSPLFAAWVRKHTKRSTVSTSTEFTHKEQALFHYLTTHRGELIRRDAIVTAVWPESTENPDLVPSDWAIDRLISRLRKKIRERNDSVAIITVRGKGYKLR